MAYVTIRLKNIEGYTRSDLARERMVLGRSSKTDLPIKHTSISREHCAFVREGDAWFIEDMGSANGTWVNKTKVAGRVALAERDIVKAGQARLTFHGGTYGDAGPEAAIDLAMDDDAGAPRGPVRTAAPNDPAEAAPCAACGSWYSIAHRLAGDAMNCPRCGHPNVVPSMST